MAHKWQYVCRCDKCGRIYTEEASLPRYCYTCGCSLAKIDEEDFPGVRHMSGGNYSMVYARKSRGKWILAPKTEAETYREPQKVKYKVLDSYMLQGEFLCPRCGKVLAYAQIGFQGDNYCKDCGQALDWYFPNKAPVKKIRLFGNGEKEEYYVCPTCGKRIYSIDKKCEYCGQKFI